MPGTFHFTPSPDAGKTGKSAKNAPPGLPLLSYRNFPVDPKKTLLGRRLLCLEGGMLIIGPSGVGKSSAIIQASLQWSIGEPAFGLVPSRPLKISIIQAEDDRGDVHEMVSGAVAFLNLTPDQVALSEQNCRAYHHKALTAQRFLNEIVEPILAQDRPDLLIINPLQAYLGADVKDTEKVSLFLRNGLNPLLEAYQCAVVIVHHTPKTNFRTTDKWRANDWMYAGAGAADITNWARVVIIIEPTDADLIYKFIAAKRGSRTGWDKEDKAHFRFFAWALNESIFWSDAIADEIKKAKSGGGKAGADEVLAIVPQTGRMEKSVLQHRANMEIPMGEKRVDKCLAQLIGEGRLFYEKETRPKIKPLIFVSRFAPVDANYNGQEEAPM